MLGLTSEDVQSLDPEVDIIIDKDDPESFCFVCKVGPYKGVAWIYINVQIIPPENLPDSESKEYHQLQFNYVEVENPNNVELGDDFQEKAGDLLVKMVTLLAEKHPPA